MDRFSQVIVFLRTSAVVSHLEIIVALSAEWEFLILFLNVDFKL